MKFNYKSFFGEEFIEKFSYRNRICVSKVKLSNGTSDREIPIDIYILRNIIRLHFARCYAANK